MCLLGKNHSLMFDESSIRENVSTGFFTVLELTLKQTSDLRPLSSSSATVRLKFVEKKFEAKSSETLLQLK